MKKQQKNKPELSIIILSYNTRDLLRDCLNSLDKVTKEVDFEVIVSDNGSKDASPQMVKDDFKWVCLIKNKNNLGFAAGNNKARSICRGKYILFLNSDTQVYPGTLTKTLDYIKENKKVGALTCKIVLTTGQLDKDSRRSFPTPWVAITHMLGLDRLFPKSETFSKYWYGYISPDTTHEVDVLQGAYFLTRKKVLDSVDWFDEDYFLDGEDVDLCWKIKRKRWKIYYYPKVSILHVKKASKRKPTGVDKRKFVTAGVESMEIFYRKHMFDRYPKVINYLVIFAVRILKYFRLLRNGL